MSGPSPPGAAAGRASLPPIWNLPYRRNPAFAFRDEVLAAVDRRLAAGEAAMVVLHGMPGVGKTQVAVEYAYRQAARYRAETC